MRFRRTATPCAAALTSALRNALAGTAFCASLLGAAAGIAGSAEAAVGSPDPLAAVPLMTPVDASAAVPFDLSLWPLAEQPPRAAETPILLAAAATKAAATKSSAGSNPSGLPWKSGTQCYSDAFESFRGRKVDVSSLYLGRASWSGVLGNLRHSSVAKAAKRPGQAAIALAMLMQGQRFSDCTAGKLDGTFKEIGQTLSPAHMNGTIVRLGWEANGTSYAWSIRDQAEPYKACFRRLVGILRKQAPNILIEWSMRKDNGASTGAHNLYPGNDVVDIIGTSFYDRYPSTNNQAQWDKAYRETKQGGPKGIGTWLDFAKSKGKKLALAEWAVSDGEPSSSKDNPFFVEKVWQFLKANSSNIAYEAYFNCTNSSANIYMIYPEKNNPQAAARYKQLWRSGT